ncbi:MAG TPA: hypothetical protein VLH09_02765 [Bryobacteraceae bacterium]|nr:hypothetical protein [Bryobacteraceae bacterium]
MPKTGWQECCSQECRKTFWKFRGPSWPRIEDAIRKEVRSQLKAAIAQGAMAVMREEDTDVR